MRHNFLILYSGDGWEWKTRGKYLESWSCSSSMIHQKVQQPNLWRVRVKLFLVLERVISFVIHYSAKVSTVVLKSSVECDDKTNDWLTDCLISGGREVVQWLVDLQSPTGSDWIITNQSDSVLQHHNTGLHSLNTNILNVENLPSKSNSKVERIWSKFFFPREYFSQKEKLCVWSRSISY